jgi:hypothetical protein
MPQRLGMRPGVLVGVRPGVRLGVRPCTWLGMLLRRWRAWEAGAPEAAAATPLGSTALPLTLTGTGPCR